MTHTPRSNSFRSRLARLSSSVLIGGLLVLTLFTASSAFAASAFRTNFVAAVLSEDFDKQAELIRSLVEANDPMVEQGLTAWRGGSLYLYETNDTKIPFLLDGTPDADGSAKGMAIIDGEFIKGADGKPLLFAQTDLTAADASSRLRKAIKATLDLFALGNPNPRMRRDAVTKLGQEQNVDYLPFFEARLKTEREKEVIKALHEAIATTQLASEDDAVRATAIAKLGEFRSITGLTFLQKLRDDARAGTVKLGDSTASALRQSIYDIEQYIWRGNMFGTAFRGLSLAAVLLVASLGLAITFGLMGVINMAHGEVMMVGAYTAYVVQNIFVKWFGPSGGGFDCYFIAALVAAFVVAGAV